MMTGFGFGGMLFGGLLMLLFWILIIVAAVWLITTVVRGNQTHVNAPGPVQTPLDILKMRYARGEITKEQFDQMKQDLGG